jgi:hypothetical protein
MTKDLYEFGKKEGKLFFQTYSGKREIPISFNNIKNNNSTVSLSLPF